MATERTYIIPLRKDVNKSPRYKRAKKASTVVREFLEKHMKSFDVKIGEKLNEALWKRGIKSPPGKIKVNVSKDAEGVVKAELFGHKYVEKKREKKVEKSKLEELKEKIAGKEESKQAIEGAPEQVAPANAPKVDEKKQAAAAEKDLKSQKGIEKSQHKGKE